MPLNVDNFVFYLDDWVKKRYRDGLKVGYIIYLRILETTWIDQVQVENENLKDHILYIKTQEGGELLY